MNSTADLLLAGNFNCNITFVRREVIPLWAIIKLILLGFIVWLVVTVIWVAWKVVAFTLSMIFHTFILAVVLTFIIWFIYRCFIKK
jgi:hypothetical protein